MSGRMSLFALGGLLSAIVGAPSIGRGEMLYSFEEPDSLYYGTLYEPDDPSGELVFESDDGPAYHDFYGDFDLDDTIELTLDYSDGDGIFHFADSPSFTLSNMRLEGTAAGGSPAEVALRVKSFQRGFGWLGSAEIQSQAAFELGSRGSSVALDAGDYPRSSRDEEHFFYYLDQLERAQQGFGGFDNRIDKSVPLSEVDIDALEQEFRNSGDPFAVFNQQSLTSFSALTLEVDPGQAELQDFMPTKLSFDFEWALTSEFATDSIQIALREPTAIPEPTAWIPLAIGCGWYGRVLYRRRRRTIDS